MAGYDGNDVYFASYEPGDPRYLDALLDKINTYRKYIESSGKAEIWRKSIRAYYGYSAKGNSSTGMGRAGDAGQFTTIKVNDFRNLAQHQLILITSQRPAGKAKAINSDPEAMKSAQIASQLVEYYLSQVGFEVKFVRTAETANIADEGYLILGWNATSGDPITRKPDEMGNPTEEFIMTGDAEMRTVPPWNMARDVQLDSPDMMKWGIASWRENKWDLAAKYKSQSEDIIDATVSRDLQQQAFNAFDTSQNGDQIELHCLYHDKTPACPNGRLTLFIGDAILLDVDFPYDEFNVYPMRQNEAMESCFGYGNNNDLLGLQDVSDSLHTILLSNNITHGTQCIIGPKGSGIVHQEVAEGFAYFEVDPAHVDKIKALQLTASSPETYKLLEIYSQKMGVIAGIDPVTRNDIQGTLRDSSGSALALIQAQSIQYNSGGQRAYYQLLQRACTGLIKMLRKFAHTERVIRITGKVQGDYLEEFKYTGKSLKDVSAVTFEVTNPLEQTIGAKDARAQDLLKTGLITDPRQYLMVARTGNLDTILEDDEAFAVAIKSENQLLRDGKIVRAILFENHEKHIEGHSAIIASPEAKQNHPLVEAVMKHIQEHLDQWKQLSMQNPALLLATHQKVLPADPMPHNMMGGLPPGPPGAPGMAPPGPVPSPGPGGPAAMNPQAPPEQQASHIAPPRMPNMPKNPLTGQRAPGPMVS